MTEAQGVEILAALEAIRVACGAISAAVGAVAFAAWFTIGWTALGLAMQRGRVQLDG